MKHLIPLAAGLLLLAGCAEDSPPPEPAEPAAPDTIESEVDEVAEDSNPLLEPQRLPYAMPPFDRIEAHHFRSALDEGMRRHRIEVERLAGNADEPTFENTIVALERTGQLLDRVQRLFSNLAGTHTNDELQAIQREMAPKLSAHRDEILLNRDLFARIETVYRQRDELELDAESHRLVERTYREFVRAGARLDDEGQDRLRDINRELAELGTEFSQRVLAGVNASALVVDSREKLDGLSDSRIQSAAGEAADRGLDEGTYVITLLNTSGQPPLASLTNREIRQQLHEASLNRGSLGDEHDTREIVARVLALRAKRAELLGYETHADYILAEQTAGSIEAVNEMHRRIGPAAIASARREGDDLQALINELEDEPFELASWDWAYYTGKLRQRRYDFDESQIRPYFELNNVLVDGVFYSATRLFGITFVERPDLPVYHPDVRIWEVFEENGSPLGLFIGDFYARSTKRGGAWMNSYRIYSDLLPTPPVVGNHLNIPKPPEGEPTLMTFDEVTTLFHEFGHAIHGLFSDVAYPRFAATAVPRDFVEYPSQVYEMWAVWPEVLKNYARHYETGESIPSELLERVLEAQIFNEGFRTTEYLAASIVDQALHQLPAGQTPSADELMAFEASVLAEWSMDYPPVPPRYRIPYFSHIMGGYSAGYYSYIWSEVLDADSVLWIKENGGLDRETGQHFRDTILSRGGSRDAMDLYREFAGRDPGIEPLLQRRGLLEAD